MNPFTFVARRASALRRQGRGAAHTLGRATLLVAVTSSSAFTPAWADTSVDAVTDQVRVRLVAPVQTVQPGQALVLGVHQRIIEHWHTYWRNPGDSGVATSIAWELPTGTTAGPIQWPAPSRFAVGPIVNYGYANEVALLTAVKVPGTLKTGDTFVVKAKVNWLVCNDICIPQDGVVSLTLPVDSAVSPASADAALVAAAQRQVPRPSPWAAPWRNEGERLALHIAGGPPLPPHDTAYFYPSRWGHVAHGEPQALRPASTMAWQLDLARGEAPPQAGETPQGVLVLSRGTEVVQAFAFGDEGPAATLVTGLGTLASKTSTTPATLSGASPAAAQPVSLLVALGLALLGGLVLNLMPCVFPVLSIKALSLFRHDRSSGPSMRQHGLAYTAGVLLSFVALATVLIALKAGGDSAGWGFQFQSPVFVLLLALLMFGVGLSLSGVFSIGNSVTGVGSSLASREGLSGSFFTGVLATVVATPCTAPFMGVAVGYALTQPAPVTLAVFVALGFGLALPYLLLCEWPALQRRLPRPGAWMEHLKHAFAFPMYASAAWLTWVLTQQAGTPALAVAFAAALALAFAAWLYQSTRGLGRIGLRAGTLASVLLLVGAVGASTLAIDPRAAPASASQTAGWEAYSPERLDDLLGPGKPVFVNLTAAWCITCLVNERVALNTDRVQSAFEQGGITRLKGDWTRQDERITKLLNEHGRSGVPLYLFYPANANRTSTVLPQLLTPELVLAALQPALKAPSP